MSPLSAQDQLPRAPPILSFLALLSAELPLDLVMLLRLVLVLLLLAPLTLSLRAL